MARPLREELFFVAASLIVDLCKTFTYKEREGSKGLGEVGGLTLSSMSKKRLNSTISNEPTKKREAFLAEEIYFFIPVFPHPPEYCGVG